MTRKESLEAVAEAARKVANAHFTNVYSERIGLIRALAEYDATPPDDTAWSPIATAPKDGTEILGWNRRLGRHIVSWGCQPQHNPHHCWISSTCNTNHIDQPTHWCPLPPPPVQDEGER